MKTLQQVLDDKKLKGTISIAPDKSVFDALLALADHNVGALAVMKNGKLVGIFSERDYARQIELKNRDSKKTLISEVMATDLVTAKPTDPLDVAMNLMNNKRIRHLPVVHENQLIGILSVGDVVNETIDYQADLIQQLETYITN